MIRAAGILFITQDRKALYLKRGPGGDYPGFWCFPGGHIEGDETELEAAEREAIEECGKIPAGPRAEWTRQIRPRDPTPLAPAPLNGSVALLPGEAAPGEEVDFTTFIQRVKEEFTPTVNGEHVGWAWAPIDQPPQPMHPGCQIALDRLGMDELAVARAMMSGLLVSPQPYDNMWLFNIRITGTGMAYRHKHNEYVWRDPSLYMNEDFVQRCMGLSVIFEHPKSAMLNSKEFNDRVVGSVFLPYLKPEASEVWGIAKIYDADAIKEMRNTQLSTSPAVVFRDPSVNTKVELDTGEQLLIEGKPSLLDHIAICEKGVWDKGGDPAGVATLVKGDSTVTDEERKAAEAKVRADAEGGDKLDKILTGLDSLAKGRADDRQRFDEYAAKVDSMSSRMDAFEAKKADDDDDDEEEEKKEDKKADKKDAAKKDDFPEDMKGKKEDKKDDDDDDDDDEDEEEDKKVAVADKKKGRKDAKKDDDDDDDARKDSVDVKAMKREIADLKRRMPLQMSDADFRKRAEVQAKADTVFQAFGDSAPRPLDGETLEAYKRRLATALKVHSPAWSKVDVAAIADAAFDVAEGQIYADAFKAADNPVDLPEDELRQITRTDHATGQRTISFVGKHSFVRDFKAPVQKVDWDKGGFLTPSAQQGR